MTFLTLEAEAAMEAFYQERHPYQATSREISQSYAPSNAILKDCVERALKPKPRLRFHASLFGRYGDSDPAEQAAIEENLQSIASLTTKLHASVKTVLGKDVTRSSFSANLSGADILHLQGHVSSPEIKQFLVLEPETTSNKDSFTLQDIFATGLDTSLAVLMGCGSGSQVISKGDDAMGLISAFFAAGVRSVVGTLWPLDNADAVTFLPNTSMPTSSEILTNQQKLLLRGKKKRRKRAKIS